MNIGILSYTWGSWYKSLRSRKLSVNEKLLLNAAKARGHRVRVFRADLCELSYADGKMRVLYAGRPFPKVDVIISRPNIVTNVDLELTLNKHLLLMGIPLLNGYMPIMRAKNKIRMLQVLSHRALPVPKTVVLKRLEYMDDAVRRVGGYPVIMKTPTGSLGRGVVIVESRRSLLSSLDLLWAKGEDRNLLIQEYVAESEGRDIRVVVVGDRIVATMQRQSADGDFRSNIGQGGVGTPIELTAEEERLAIEATKAFGLDVSGVDLLRTHKGPVIMEINANPGLQGITEATGLDVAGAIVELAASKVESRKKNPGQEFRGGLMSLETMTLEEPFSVI